MCLGHYNKIQLIQTALKACHFKFTILKSRIIANEQLFVDSFQGLMICTSVDNSQNYFSVLIDFDHKKINPKDSLTRVINQIETFWKDRKETYNIFLGKPDYEVETL